MAGKSDSKSKEQKTLLDYKFDTSSYVILSSSVRRDADSGRLVKVKKSAAKSS
ncbi:hypothetical protein MASR1M12_03690 [Erysipelotrichia bacterium]